MNVRYGRIRLRDNTGLGILTKETGPGLLSKNLDILGDCERERPVETPTVPLGVHQLRELDRFEPRKLDRLHGEILID